MPTVVVRGHSRKPCVFWLLTVSPLPKGSLSVCTGTYLRKGIKVTTFVRRLDANDQSRCPSLLTSDRSRDVALRLALGFRAAGIKRGAPHLQIISTDE